MEKTTYHVAEMDCPSEERIIRLRMEAIAGVDTLVFDLTGRQLDVYHHGAREAVGRSLDTLALGAEEIGHEGDVQLPDGRRPSERHALTWALAINLALFAGESLAGLIAGSMGLVADSCDMLADAAVYALSLAAVGTSALRKTRLAAMSGYLQLVLALLGVAEVARRFVWEQAPPDVLTMVVVSCVALAGNAATLVLLRGTDRKEIHIQASWIFTSNDIKVNVLVIAAAAGVGLSGSRVPDLVVGAVIFLIVASGARRILRLARGSAA